MMNHLSYTVGGERIPENITPRELLDLKRGFGNEFIHRWNPETVQGVKGTAANTYHAMGDEFNNAVPGARELNGRISRLIPIAKRGESAELNAPVAQRVAHRLAAHTGALAGAVGGGYAGYRHGGIGDAILGGTVGLLAPELIASPTTEMMAARTLDSGSPYVPRLFSGLGLQLQNKSKKPNNK